VTLDAEALNKTGHGDAARWMANHHVTRVPTVTVFASPLNGVREATLLARIMAMNTLPLATVRNQLSALVDDVNRTHDTLTITRNGKSAAVLISADDYESIMETLALLNDPIDCERLDEAERAVATGDVTKGEDIDRLLAERVQRDTGAA